MVSLSTSYAPVLYAYQTLIYIDQIHTKLQTTKPGGEALHLAVHAPDNHTHKQLQPKDASWLNSQNDGLGDWLVKEVDNHIGAKTNDARHKAWMRKKKQNPVCYGMHVISKRPIEWNTGYEETRACTYCSKAGRPCILMAQTSTGAPILVVLPVLNTEAPEDIDWTSKDTWIRGATKAKPT